MIAVHGVKTTVTDNDEGNDSVEDDDYEDDDGDDAKELDPTIDHIPNVQDNLKAMGLYYWPQEHYEFKETESQDIIAKTNGIARVISDRYKEFTGVLSKKDSEYDMDKYPQNKRFSIFIDRRKQKPSNVVQKKGDSKDQITMFQPPKECNTLPNDHVPGNIAFAHCLIILYFFSIKQR